MMKGLILLIMIMAIAFSYGCASNVIKLEKDVAMFMKDDTLSTDCKAGIAAASILAPDTTASVRIVAEAMQQYADKKSHEYQDCFVKTAFFSFAIRGGIDEIGKIAREIMTLGVLP